MTTAVEPGSWIVILALASLSVVSTAVGVGLARWAGPRAAMRAAGVGFSVGVMLMISFVDLLPEARRQAGWAVAVGWAIAGAGLLALAHLTIPHVHLFDESGVGAPALRRAYLVAFGLILHDFPEGFAMANAYLSAPRLGVLVAVAIVLHNIPEEFAMALPVVLTRRRRLLLGTAAASAAAEPLGAAIGIAAVSVSPGLNAAFLAFAAGAMIFVSLHELVPLSRELGRWRDTIVGIGTGAVVVVALGLVLGA